MPVSTSTTIGPRDAKPLQLDIPLFSSDISFGALSEETKTAFSRAAEMAGIGICSGEGGMSAEEQVENSRYFYELASVRFGWKPELVESIQAFHFKRGLEPGQSAISSATFTVRNTPGDFRILADEMRKRFGGIPIGFNLSANHIDDDVDFALEASAEYINLDGCGSGTGATPLI